MAEHVSRLFHVMEMEEEHENDIIYYRKVYSNIGKDSHDEPSFGCFLRSKAINGDGSFNEVVTEETYWLQFDECSGHWYYHCESQDVLTDEEVNKLINDKKYNSNTLTFARTFDFLHRISYREYYDVMVQLNTINLMELALDNLYQRL